MREPAVNIEDQIPIRHGEEPAHSPVGLSRKMARILIGTSVALAMALGFYWFVYLSRFATTDDAYIEAEIYSVNSRILGYVKEVNVSEGDSVKAGQVLAVIDETDLKFEQNYKKLKYDKADSDYKRARTLHKSTAISDYDLENAASALKATEVDLQGTELKLKYTKILSPAEGAVAKRSIQQGQFVQPGQTLLVVVNDSKPWVKANFKETQIENIKPGQKTRISIDAYPHTDFTGVVKIIYPSSGAKLSILPPENATGNFTRVVQRVPVRIDLLDLPEGIKLRPGMSVQVTVDTRSKPTP